MKGDVPKLFTRVLEKKKKSKINSSEYEALTLLFRNETIDTDLIHCNEDFKVTLFHFIGFRKQAHRVHEKPGYCENNALSYSFLNIV